MTEDGLSGANNTFQWHTAAPILYFGTLTCSAFLRQASLHHIHSSEAGHIPGQFIPLASLFSVRSLFKVTNEKSASPTPAEQ